MDDTLNPYPRRDVLLAVFPGAVWLAARLVIAASPDLWPFGWVAEALTLASCAVVIGAALLRERRVTLWALPALGIAIQNVWVLSEALLRAGMTADWYATGRALIGLSMGILAGALIGAGIWAARRWGGAAALLASGPLGWFAFGILDPTYGLLILAPQTYSPLGVALLDTIPMALFLVALPAAVLRAGSGQAQVARMLGGFALALASIVPILTLHAFALQGVLGARPVIVELGYTLALGPLVAGIFWIIMAGLTFGLSRLRRGDTAPPHRAAA